MFTWLRNLISKKDSPVPEQAEARLILSGMLSLEQSVALVDNLIRESDESLVWHHRLKQQLERCSSETLLKYFKGVDRQNNIFQARIVGIGKFSLETLCNIYIESHWTAVVCAAAREMRPFLQEKSFEELITFGEAIEARCRRNEKTNASDVWEVIESIISERSSKKRVA